MGNLRSGSVVVTGAGGFIGSHVVEALLAMGQRVVGVDNFDPFYSRAAKEANVEACRRAGGDRFSFIECDIVDRASLARAFEGLGGDKVVGVIHLAAKAGVRPSIADPAGYMRTNVVGTSVVLEEAKRVGAQRVVVASSSSVYGNAARVPFGEEQAVDQPISPYAASKCATELVCRTHHALHRTPVACLRFFTVFGPRQRPDLAISLFLGRVARGEEIQMFGDGSSSRDYTYIDDIVRGVLAAYERVDRHGFRIWNLGGSHPCSLRDLIATIERVVGKPAWITRQPMQAGDVERTYADLARSKAELGFEPRVGLEEGVRRQWEWMRDAM